MTAKIYTFTTCRWCLFFRKEFGSDDYTCSSCVDKRFAELDARSEVLVKKIKADFDRLNLLGYIVGGALLLTAIVLIVLDRVH